MEETIKYTKKQIEDALNIINLLPVTGIQNAKRIVMLFDIFEHPVIEKKEE